MNSRHSNLVGIGHWHWILKTAFKVELEPRVKLSIAHMIVWAQAQLRPLGQAEIHSHTTTLINNRCVHEQLCGRMGLWVPFTFQFQFSFFSNYQHSCKCHMISLWPLTEQVSTNMWSLWDHTAQCVQSKLMCFVVSWDHRSRFTEVEQGSLEAMTATTTTMMEIMW